EINDKYTLTLKQPLEEGLLETHDNLSKSDFLQWKNNQHPIGDEVEIALKEIGILLSDLKYYGKLKTERYLYKRNGLEYVLDYSQYLGKEDYELEVEAETYQKGENAFTDLTEKFNIEQQMPISKIERFMTQLNKA